MAGSRGLRKAPTVGNRGDDPRLRGYTANARSAQERTLGNQHWERIFKGQVRVRSGSRPQEVVDGPGQAGPFVVEPGDPLLDLLVLPPRDAHPLGVPVEGRVGQRRLEVLEPPLER